jgi:hypothetical protein
MARIRYSWEHSEVALLAANLAVAPANTEAELELTVRRSANRLTTLWRADARASSGKHGKRYPQAIRPHIDGLEAYVQPDPEMPQGGMAFEYGGPSVVRFPSSSPDAYGAAVTPGTRVGQNKPHLSMNKAADIVFPEFHREVADEAVIRL